MLKEINRKQLIMDFSDTCSNTITLKKPKLRNKSQKIYSINYLKEKQRKELLNYIIKYEKSF